MPRLRFVLAGMGAPPGFVCLGARGALADYVSDRYGSREEARAHASGEVVIAIMHAEYAVRRAVPGASIRYVRRTDLPFSVAYTLAWNGPAGAEREIAKVLAAAIRARGLLRATLAVRPNGSAIVSIPDPEHTV